MRFRTAFENREKVSKDFSETESLTQQSEGEFTTIRAYIDKYTRLGVLGNPARLSEAQFGDFSSLPHDYGEAVELIQSVTDAFNALPAKVRARYKEDPAQFAKALGDPEEVAALVKEGYLSAQPQAETKQEPPKAAPSTSEAQERASALPQEAGSAAE